MVQILGEVVSLTRLNHSWVLLGRQFNTLYALGLLAIIEIIGRRVFTNFLFWSLIASVSFFLFVLIVYVLRCFIHQFFLIIFFSIFNPPIFFMLNRIL